MFGKSGKEIGAEKYQMKLKQVVLSVQQNVSEIRRGAYSKHFLSVFIIHIHIDRFLIQHGFDSVTVFFSA